MEDAVREMAHSGLRSVDYASGRTYQLDTDGLCGVNCRHTFYPFFEGISETAKWDKEPEPREYSGKTYTYYDMTQKQRQMERNVRATKREIEAQRAIGGEVGALEARKRTQIAEYHRFSKEMGISAKDNRLRVVKGSSDLNRTQTYKEVKRGQELKSGALNIKK